MKQTILVCDRHAGESRPATQSFVIRPLGEAARRVDLCDEDVRELAAVLWPEGRAALGLGRANGVRQTSQPRKPIPDDYEYRNGRVRPILLKTKNPLLVDVRGHRRPQARELVRLLKMVVERPGMQPRVYMEALGRTKAAMSGIGEVLRAMKAMTSDGRRAAARWTATTHGKALLAEAERVLAGQPAPTNAKTNANGGTHANEKRSATLRAQIGRQPLAARHARTAAARRALAAKHRAKATS